MKICVASKIDVHDPSGIIKKSVQFLKKNGANVDHCPGFCGLKKFYDAIIVFGGDGSILKTVQSLKNFDSAVLSINMGRLGFFSDSPAKEYLKVLKKLLSGDYKTESRMLLRCTVMRGNLKAFTRHCLNEVTIARDSLARMISLKTTVDDLPLTTYVADGLLVAPPTGSTGYSLSAGGPIVSHFLDAIILTPISPHSFTQKPIVLPPNSMINVEISTSHDRVHLTLDGQTGFHLKDHDIVKIRKSSKRLNLIRMTKHSYFDILRDKLHWGIDLSGRK